MNMEIDGCKIYYKITGSGSETVVILQGWGTNLAIYDPIASIISEKYRVVQFDFPGFGASDEPSEAWNVDAYADFFCKFMIALNIESATLIGHSYGGRVIIKLANRVNLPFAIDKIVLIDSAGVMHKKSPAQKLKIKKYKMLKKFFGGKFMNALFPELVEDWKNRQGSADYQKASPLMKQALVMAVNEDLTGLLSSITRETLIIWGDKDDATPIGDAKIMEAEIPNSGLAVLQGAGHFSFLEQPVIFKNIMCTYFRIGEEYDE